MAGASESGRNRNERQEHDRESREYEATTGNPYHLSKAVRGAAAVLAILTAVALTGLFVIGAFHL